MKFFEAIGTALLVSIATAIAWLPIMKFISDKPVLTAFSWRWDLKEYCVFWVTMISWTILIVPLSFFGLFYIFKGEIGTSVLSIFIAFVAYSIQRVVRNL